MKNFNKYLNDFDWRILQHIGGEELPTDHNAVVRALAENDNFVEEAGINGKELTALSRLAVLCQMAVYDATGGPDQDGQRKSLRRHWYAYFKTSFAQPFSRQRGEDLQDKNWAANWTKRISAVYADLVTSTDLTYHDLWVFDGSRMMDAGNERIASGYNLIVCVEKDSLFPDFQAAARRLGARALYSGKGVSSLAAVEKLLREAFDWGRWRCCLDDEPLYVIHISDYDYDGEAVIGPTFAAQCRVFVDNVIEGRVGIKPEQVEATGNRLQDAWYEVSTPHKAAKSWAAERGLEGKYGLEVEALRTGDYYRLLADVFLSLVNFADLAETLRDECTPDTGAAAARAQDAYLKEDPQYQRIKKALRAYERTTLDVLWTQARRLAADIEPPEGDPTEEDFRRYVESRQTGGPWRPFDRREQTTKLKDAMLKDSKCRRALSALSLEL